jgi:hypothetical protein
MHVHVMCLIRKVLNCAKIILFFAFRALIKIFIFFFFLPLNFWVFEKQQMLRIINRNCIIFTHFHLLEIKWASRKKDEEKCYIHWRNCWEQSHICSWDVFNLLFIIKGTLNTVKWSHNSKWNLNWKSLLKI